LPWGPPPTPQARPAQARRADVIEQAEVLGELPGKPPGGFDVPAVDCYPHVPEAAQVLDQELVDSVSFLAGDHGDYVDHGVLHSVGHRKSRQRYGRQNATAVPSLSHRRLLLRCRPRGVCALPGRFLQLSRPNVGGRKRRLKACRQTSLGPHVAPGVAPAAISHCSSDPRKAGIPLHKRDCRNAPDRIRTCDLRFRRPTLYPTELRARVEADGRLGGILMRRGLRLVPIGGGWAIAVSGPRTSPGRGPSRGRS
jgi:hypothetical protein